MLRAGIFVTLIGFASAVLYFADIHFRLLAWADDMQPAFGFIVGAAGLAALGIGYAVGKRKNTEAPQAAAPLPQAPQN